MLGALSSGGALVPTPIGTGPGYRLPAAPSSLARAEHVGRFRCDVGAGRRVRAHVELFANRRVLLLPAGIGMTPPLVRDGALVARARCSYDVRT